MVPWVLLERVVKPNGEGDMTLHQRGDEFVIRVDGHELMNSRLHGSEEAMATMTCSSFAADARPRVLVGGLGMGFTTAAACAVLPANAHIDVAEWMPAVVRWNRGPLGACAGRPLEDPRVQVHEADVRALLERPSQPYDVVLLDVDNGPAGLTQVGNGWLYSSAGLAVIRRALTPSGVLSVWSAAPDAAYDRRLKAAGWNASTHTVRGRKNGKGPRHTIWVARPRTAGG
jgi:spermidine synthase